MESAVSARGENIISILVIHSRIEALSSSSVLILHTNLISVFHFSAEPKASATVHKKYITFKIFYQTIILSTVYFCGFNITFNFKYLIRQ